MRIAMLGTRGVPASYSGFETCVEELGSRLAQRGHEVTVYCRSHHIKYGERTYKGMQLVKLPTIPNKYLDTIVHTFVSMVHASLHRHDIAMTFIAGNSLACWIPRLAGIKVVLNVDGLDWKREKWPIFAKKYIQFAEYLATVLPHEVVTDSRRVQQYYRERFKRDSVYIAYGADVETLPPGPFLKRYGLEPGGYVLFVGRLVPENCAHHLVEAFQRLDTELKCVIVGDAPYAEDYIAELRDVDDPRIVFTGYLFGEGYRELCSNCYVFIETSEVGGTHPALVEAMAFGNCVVVNDTPENLETIADAGLSYVGEEGPTDLRRVLRELMVEPAQVEAYRDAATDRARRVYSWEKVTNQYENLFGRLLNRDTA